MVVQTACQTQRWQASV